MQITLLPTFVALSLFSPAVISASTRSSSSYIGAVVDYRPVTEGRDGLEVAKRNANNVRTIVEKAAEYNTDIIVFPEVGLSSLPANLTGWSTDKIRRHYHSMASYVPEPRDKVVMCDSGDDYAEALKSVSCTAKKFQIYVVVNHYEKVDHHGNFLLYNTNLAFDRRGRLIARYRKYNLFFEPGVNVTARAELSIFDTDFGVRFGQIVCNDILYVEPALELARSHGITDVVFSAEWFSELPFLTSLQTHSAWAYANDVNLLSSGFNEPAIANGGSGIYLGKDGVAKATMPNVAANTLVVAEIPKVVDGRRHRLSTTPRVYRFSQSEVPTAWDDAAAFMYKDDFRAYTTEIVDPRRCSRKRTLCNRGLCCDFEIDASFDDELAGRSGANYYRFRIGVFNGTRLFAGAFTVGIEVCGLFFCRDDDLSSCGDRFGADAELANPTVFHRVKIERKINSVFGEKKFYLPATLTTSLEPIDYAKIEFHEYRSGENNGTVRKLTLRESESELMAFAIYGRNLANDGADLTKP